MNNMNSNVTSNHEEKEKRALKIVRATPEKTMAGAVMLFSNKEALERTPEAVRECFSACHLLYGGGVVEDHYLEEIIPEEAEKGYSIVCDDIELMLQRFSTRAEAEASAPKDGRFCLIYESPSEIYYRGVSVTGVPVEEGVLYDDKMQAAMELLKIIKPDLVKAVKEYAGVSEK